MDNSCVMQLRRKGWDIFLKAMTNSNRKRFLKLYTSILWKAFWLKTTKWKVYFGKKLIRSKTLKKLWKVHQIHISCRLFTLLPIKFLIFNNLSAKRPQKLIFYLLSLHFFFGGGVNYILLLSNTSNHNFDQNTCPQRTKWKQCKLAPSLMSVTWEHYWNIYNIKFY